MFNLAKAMKKFSFEIGIFCYKLVIASPVSPNKSAIGLYVELQALLIFSNI